VTNTPTQTLLIMRHAEKPDDDTDPHLAPVGQVRAQQLASYIPQTFGTPSAIIAAADSNRSVRPRETVEPLAASIPLTIQTPYADAQFAKLAANIGRRDAFPQPLIVICWHHGEIPKLMHGLGAAVGSYPASWDKLVFNLILKTELKADGTVLVTQVQEPF